MPDVPLPPTLSARLSCVLGAALLQVLLVLLLSCFSWRLAPRMGGPAGVLSQTVAALELRVASGMWLTPVARDAAAP